MATILNRGDAIREYYSGAASAGGVQTDPDLCLGNYISSTEAVSLGISLINTLTGVNVQFASGGNPIGRGVLSAPDGTHLTWIPNGGSVGQSQVFSGTNDVELVEGANAGQFLRISGTPNFSVGTMLVDLEYLADNVFGFDEIDSAQAAAGVSQYRATLLKNVSAKTVIGIQRWLATLGTAQISDSTHLGSSGSGTITTTGSFADWPYSGWCQIQTSGGTLREVVYYTSRTSTALTVPSAGRALLGTSAGAGSATDAIFSTPGVAIGVDTSGAVLASSAIQTIANANTAPTSVTWNVGLSAQTGLQIGSLQSGYMVGIWMWRQIPVGATATPSAVTKFFDNFAVV